MRIGAHLAVAVCFAALSTNVSAQNGQGFLERLRNAANDDRSVLMQLAQLESQLGSGNKDAVVRNLMQQLFQYSPSGELTAELVSEARALETAQRRANGVAALLRLDLNDDGVISAADRSTLPGSDSALLETLLGIADTNADGVVDYTEMRAYASSQLDERRSNRGNIVHLLDVNGDGTVVPDEIFEAISLIEAEGLNLQPTRSTLGTDRRVASCDAPKPGEDQQIVVLSAYEGEALSTVSVAGMDRVTHLADLVIEPGDDPIYLFVTSYANMIWNVTGATDRIAQMIVQPSRRDDKPAVGVIGIEEKRITFLTEPGCMERISSIEGGEGQIAYRQIARHLGADPDTMIARYGIQEIALPSGQAIAEDGEGRDIIIYDGRRYEMTPEGPKLLDETEGQFPSASPFGAEVVWRSLTRFNSGGIREVEAADVVSPAGAEPYDVLPQEAGLLQLLLEGKIRYTRDGYFIIEEPIARYPAGLAGAHHVQFIIAEGVPEPAGSPGHSCVVSAETGEKRGTCR